MLKRVACILPDRVSPFEFGVVCEVFGFDRTADGLPGYEFSLCTPGGRPVRAETGFVISGTDDLGPVETADLVVIPALPLEVEVAQEVLAALRRAADRGAYILSLCSGVFALGAAGLLDGRRCTAHWKRAAARVRRWLIPTSLASPCTTSPGPTPSKQTRSDQGVRTIPPRCTRSAPAPNDARARIQASPTTSIDTAMSARHAG